jgi:hypothetical protein
MARTTTTCTACGVAVETAGPFVGADVVGALCAGCVDRRFVDGGGCVFTLHGKLDEARFALGKVTITPGAVAALAESAQHAVTFLRRHVRGDWGAHGNCDRIVLTDDERRRGWEATGDDAKINKWNLLSCRDRIMSDYETNSGGTLWVITYLEGMGWTTVLLPDEY